MTLPAVRTFACASALIWVLGMAVACGGGSTATPPAAPNAVAPSTPSLEELRQVLHAKLEKLGKDPQRSVSLAPSGNENKVFNLEALPLKLNAPEGVSAPVGVLLQWTEQLAGDYDQNGLVTISDLGPLGLYWQQSLSYVDPRAEGARWPSADGTTPAPLYDTIWRLARVDGEPNGLITLGDISPIAKHWGEGLSGYRAFREDPPGSGDFFMVPGDIFTELTPEPQRGLLTVPRRATFPQGSLSADPDHGVHYAFFDQSMVFAGDNAYAVAPFDAETSADGPRSASVVVTVPDDLEPPDSTGVNLPIVSLSTLGPASGDAPLAVFFAAEIDSQEPVATVLWDFFGRDGDIHASTGRQVSTQYLYQLPGHYKAVVYALLPGGHSSSAMVDVDVLDNGNSLPVARLSATPPSGPAPLLVTLDASASTDVEGIVGYEFDPLGNGEFISNADLPTVDYTYPEGEYDAVVRVRDTNGAVSTATTHVSVGPIDSEPPTLTIATDLVGGEYAPEVVEFTFTVDDPEDGPMTLEIDYQDDGIFDETIPVTDGDYQRTHNYATFGSHTLRARVTDDHTLAVEETVSFTLLENLPPIAQLSADTESGPAPLTVNFDASASSDPEGQPLSFFWDFDGDGSYVGPLTALESYTYYQFRTRGAWVRVVDSEGASSEIAVPVTTTSGWEISSVLSAGSGTQEVSLAIIDGNPAIAYHRNGTLYYARSDNAEGSSWTVATLLHSPDFGAIEPTLAEVSGAPAIAYLSNAGHLYFIRANDSEGDSWGSPQQVDFLSGSGAATDLAMIEGRPAIAWVDSLSHLNYVRAQDANGQLWGTPHDLGENGAYVFKQEIDLDTVGNLPAIVASTGSAVLYHRAADVDGMLWAPAQIARSDATLRRSAAMAVPPLGLPGPLPTVLYYNADGLYATRAADAAGTTWSAPVQIAAVDTSQWQAFTAPELEAKLVGTGLATLTVFSGYFDSADAFGNSWNAQNGILDGNEPLTVLSYDIADVAGKPLVALETSGGLSIARLN